MMTLDRVASVLGARSDRSLEGVASAGGVSTDSRSLREGDLFFALRGPRFDGHDYVAEAFRRGARGAVVERLLEVPGPQLLVADARRALGALAAAVRMTHRARFVSVSGSNGKTTTKEMLGHLLAAGRRLVKPPASYNNDIGVPLTILSAPPDTDVVLLELGTNHRGEIASLGAMARPDVAVVTSIGEEHLEGLGDLEGVAAEEAAILDFVRAGGRVYAPAEAAELGPHLRRLPPQRVVTFGVSDGADVRVGRIEAVPGGIRFEIRGTPFEMPLRGAWNALNAAAAVAAAESFGLTTAECAERLRAFRGPKMRMEALRLCGVEILNDAYNSNPASALRAVAEFGRRPSGGRKIAVIGDMGELGPMSTRYHLELGRALAREESIDTVLLVGPETAVMGGTLREDQPRYHFATVDEARATVVALVRPGDAVLLKGSRSMALEKVVKFLAEAMVHTRGGPRAVEVA